MEISKEPEECNFCGEVTTVMVMGKNSKNEPSKICFGCVSKARRLISEYNVNKTERLEDIQNRNSFS